MKVAYYPGCSLHGLAKEYGISVEVVCKHLGINLKEIEDWNCCGATAAHSLNHDLYLFFLCFPVSYHRLFYL